jgi:hypothetical protein
MHFRMQSPLIGIAMSGTFHGLTDLRYDRNRLWPYCLVLLPKIPGTSVLFFSSSILHFGNDIGFVASAMMHSVVGTIAMRNISCASSLMCLYYIFIHIPTHVKSVYDNGERELAQCIYALSSVAMPFLFPRNEFVLTSRLQMLVIAHVLVNLNV